MCVDQVVVGFELGALGPKRRGSCSWWDNLRLSVNPNPVLPDLPSQGHVNSGVETSLNLCLSRAVK